jgi:uncharacterized protein YbbC (DUF1343 family)
MPLDRRTFIGRLALLPLVSLPWASPLRSQSMQTGFRLGIDVLAEDGFSILKGKRVGLLTHPAGVNGKGHSTIQVLREALGPGLVALFGPEHGIYGDEKANVPVDDRIDPGTGLPVFSLYGKFRRPTPAMLARLDTMVIDLQDIGSRSYTYVSCMRYVLEELFKAGKTAVILDRPNPLGGLKTDGPPLDPSWESYVGAFPVPYVHGLTIGELATMARNEPGVMKIPDNVRRRGRLQVVRMKGWERSMMWPETGLKWIPTSPAIPDLSAVLGYPMTGLGAQLGGFRHGYGTRLPFRLLQYAGRSPENIAQSLSRRSIPGLQFPVIPFQEKGQARRATFVKVSNWRQLRPTELSLHMMVLACQWSRENPFSAATESAQGLFTKHVGDPAVIEALKRHGARMPMQDFLRRWAAYNAQYRKAAQRWHLYS